MVEAPHLATTRPAGAVLTPADIEMRPIPLKQAESMGVPTLDQLIGKQLTRQSRGGMLLRASDVAERASSSATPWSPSSSTRGR